MLLSEHQSHRRPSLHLAKTHSEDNSISDEHQPGNNSWHSAHFQWSHLIVIILYNNEAKNMFSLFSRVLITYFVVKWLKITRFSVFGNNVTIN